MDNEPEGRTPTLYWILLTAVAAVMAFYYLTRADVIGVLAHGTWTPMTGVARPAWIHFTGAALLLGALPLAVACWATRSTPRDLGLGLGHWREGLLWVAIGVPLAVIAGRIAAGNPAMRAVYPLYPGLAEGGTFWGYAALQLVYYAAFETLFRGVLLFGLKPALGGRAANLVQTGLATTAHFGRAVTETLSALPASLAFGAVALRTRSIWYVTVIHWTVGVSMDWFIVHGVWG